METQTAYCSACDQQVRIVVTPQPVHGGQATLDDGPDVVCLDFGHKCTGSLCPMFGLPRILMGVKLAQSGLKPDEEWESFRAPCQGCSQMVDLRIIDALYALCPSCSARNRYARVTVGDEQYVGLAQEP
ncbi:MAG: hypothetical protein WEB88_10280 [Gemmatimonadota bacterium]